MRLLYFCPYSYGGLAAYADHQSEALARAGVEVTVLGTPEFRRGDDRKYRLDPRLVEIPKGERSLGRKLRHVLILLRNARILARIIREEDYRCVLFQSYLEYLAPLWSGPLRRLAGKGVCFGAIVHDPERSYIVGPYRWHRWSIACGYSFLREAFVHEEVKLDTARPMPRLQTTVIPHGTYEFPPASRSREEVRAQLEIPSGNPMMLSFGHIRDGKNLDLVLEAMTRCPVFHLVVAGNEIVAGQKPAAHYRELAEKLGIDDRCHWDIRFIPDEEIGDYFEAADIALLTYRKEFLSASGVLNTAVFYRRPCIASSGDGQFRRLVENYRLGIWTEPDDAAALAQAMQRWLDNPPAPDWSGYDEENSWRHNAELVRDRFAVSAA